MNSSHQKRNSSRKKVNKKRRRSKNRCWNRSWIGPASALTATARQLAIICCNMGKLGLTDLLTQACRDAGIDGEEQYVK